MNELYNRLKDMQFESLRIDGTYKKVINNRYDIYFSNYIKDYYYNFAANIKVLSKEELIEVYNKISKIMKEENTLPVIYLNSYENSINYISDYFKLVHTDQWMLLDNLDDFKVKDCKLDIVCKEANDKKLFITTMLKNYSSDSNDDPYGDLGDGYKESLINSFDLEDEKYDGKNYVAEYKGEIIATSCVVSYLDIAILTGVTTNPNYRKKGVCNYLIKHIIDELKLKGVKYLCLQTEKGYYPVKVYENMGFKSIFTGNCYTKR